MTPAGRIRESISSLRSQSAWSPMPEHLLFQQLEKDKSPAPVTPDGNTVCETCGMKFKTEAMLTYHKIGFCVGPPTEEISPRSSFRLDSELIIDNPQPNLQTTAKQQNKQQKLQWCPCADGAVPSSAVKVGYDDSDQIYTYICVAQVGEEVIPGTVLPPRKHATVTFNGEEVKTSEYSVLAGLEDLVSWKRCDVAGGIPRDAVKGGYDSKGLQYFIARGKAPDGNWCCGKYIPQKQQCYFAWEGTEFETKDFEFLCKNKSKQYFSDTTADITFDGNATAKSEKTTENAGKLNRDFTELPPSNTELSLGNSKLSGNNKLPKSDTDVIERSTSKVTIKSTRADTGIIEQNKGKPTKTMEITKSGTEVMAPGKTKVTASEEHFKSSSNLSTKEREKTSSARGLTKSGTAVVSKDKSKANSSRTNTVIRQNSKNLQF